MRNISPAEMIEWFEAKSSEFKGIAKTLRETFNSQGEPVVQSSKNGAVQNVTVEFVKTTLGELKTARHSQIAEALGVHAEDVKDVLSEHPEVFEMTGRGWWSLRK
jgi:hypothetical protein